MKIEILLLLGSVQLAFGIIYRLNDTEYARLPPLFRLEDFDKCLQSPGDLYCYLDAKIVPDSSDLYELIEEYSADTISHFDHKEIHWGICVTQTCRQHFNSSIDLEDNLNICLNSILQETHDLQIKVVNETAFCTNYGEVESFDTGDYVVSTIFIILLMLNTLGTLYDFICQGNRSFASKFLRVFSIRRSWRRLTMPPGEGPEPRLTRLKGLNGFKVMTTVCVIFAHTGLTGFIAVDNPKFQEWTYHNLGFQFLYNGTHVVQTFFVISGFLLSYNILIAAEKRPVTWDLLPKGILLRWLRLTPVYAVVLAFVSTLLRHLKSGPLWKPIVNVEVVDCRRDWWLHLLYVDNYIDYSQCMPQSWYLSGDMQLSIIGLAIFYLLKTNRSRRIAVIIVFIIGVITPAAHTYFQDLHAVLIVAPLMALNFFVKDATFNNLYKRGHTNLGCYAIGLALGMALHHLNNRDFKIEKHKIFRYIYWSCFPMGCILVACGCVFYTDGIQVPLAVRVVYSSSVKTCFGACMAALVIGTILKVDNVYRRLLEWRGWTVPARLSYCAYLVHVCIIRTSLSYCTALRHTTVYQTVLLIVSIIGFTFIVALPLWLLVESPIGQLIKLSLGGSRRPISNSQDLAASKETVKVQL